MGKPINECSDDELRDTMAKCVAIQQTTRVEAVHKLAGHVYDGIAEILDLRDRAKKLELPCEFCTCTKCNAVRDL